MRVVSWVFSNVHFKWTGLEGFPSAKWVLQHRIGTCGEMSRLAVAMIRSYGLPARIVAGTMASPNGMTNHGWGEFYLPGVGWAPFEPDLGYVGWIDANHMGVASVPDETSVGEWFKASAICARRRIGPPGLIELKDVSLRYAYLQAQLCLTLQNETGNHVSTRAIVTEDEATFGDGRMDAPYDDLLYLPPRSAKDICLALGDKVAGTTLSLNLSLGAYYRIEIEEGKVTFEEIPQDEYVCGRRYEPKDVPPWKQTQAS